MKTTFVDELFVLCPHCSGKFHHRKLANVAASLHTKLLSTQWEQERERTEVVTLREIGAHRTRKLPELSTTMNKRLFISEVVRVALHRNPETLSKDVVT